MTTLDYYYTTVDENRQTIIINLRRKDEDCPSPVSNVTNVAAAENSISLLILASY